MDRNEVIRKLQYEASILRGWLKDPYNATIITPETPVEHATRMAELYDAAIDALAQGGPVQIQLDLEE